MTIARLPVTTSIDPELASGDFISNGAFSKNVLFEKYPDGRIYATQRPNLNLLTVQGDLGVVLGIVNSQGRGIYYWSAVGTYIIVNNDTVYSGSYANPLAQHISPGHNKVYMTDLGDYLIILDAENNQGWYINKAAPLTLIAIPFIADITTKGLAGGVAVLNGILYVMTKDKFIYNSNSYDPTVWNAINFVRAEREYDEGVFLTKHHDHICAMGTRSIEFFYDAGNPVGSPLNRRDDTAYRIGPVNYQGVYSTDDKIYFIGSERAGGLALYELVQFAPVKRSTASIEAYISFVWAHTQSIFFLAGYSNGPHDLLFISPVSLQTGTTLWRADFTLVYDITNSVFTQFDSHINGMHSFGAVAGTSRSATLQRDALLIFVDGNIGTLTVITPRQDSSGSGGYFTIPDYIINQDDYILPIGGDSILPFEVIIKVGESDEGSVTNKFQNRLSIVGTTTSTGTSNAPLMVSWSDDHYKTFSAERPLDTGLNRSLTRGGKFKRRAYQIRYNGTDALRIEGIEIDVRASRYA